MGDGSPRSPVVYQRPYLAAYDVHQATLYGRCAASTGIEPFMALVEQVMTQEPYKSAKRVLTASTP